MSSVLKLLGFDDGRCQCPLRHGTTIPTLRKTHKKMTQLCRIGLHQINQPPQSFLNVRHIFTSRLSSNILIQFMNTWSTYLGHLCVKVSVKISIWYLQRDWHVKMDDGNGFGFWQSWKCWLGLVSILKLINRINFFSRSSLNAATNMMWIFFYLIFSPLWPSTWSITTKWTRRWDSVVIALRYWRSCRVNIH